MMRMVCLTLKNNKVQLLWQELGIQAKESQRKKMKKKIWQEFLS